MSEVQIVVAHQERATLRVGDTFLKVDVDQARLDVEVQALRDAPVPTPRILWHEPPVLALAALPGRPLGRLGEASTASAAAWRAAGATARILHEAPLPAWAVPSKGARSAQLEQECRWIAANRLVALDVLEANRAIARTVLRPFADVFTHGDLQVAHVFVEHDEVTGVLDWSDAGPGDAHYDLACLTIGHHEHLADVVDGYGSEVDLEVIRGWWSMRCLLALRWLTEHGFDPAAPGCEIDVLRSQVARS